MCHQSIAKSIILLKITFHWIADIISLEPVPNNRPNDITGYRLGWSAGILLDIGFIFTACEWTMIFYTIWLIQLVKLKMWKFQSGKVHFSYIYGIGVLGCLAFYALLSVMATQANVTVGAVVSVLGYCLLPMVVLSGINVLIALQ